MEHRKVWSSDVLRKKKGDSWDPQRAILYSILFSNVSSSIFVLQCIFAIKIRRHLLSDLFKLC